MRVSATQFCWGNTISCSLSISASYYSTFSDWPPSRLLAFRAWETQESCRFQNAILTREYDFTSAPDFGFLSANRNPAACSRCENENWAKTENRQSCPVEGLGSFHPQRDGRRERNSFWSFRIRWPYLALEMSQEKFFEKVKSSTCKGYPRVWD